MNRVLTTCMMAVIILVGAVLPAAADHSPNAAHEQLGTSNGAQYAMFVPKAWNGRPLEEDQAGGLDATGASTHRAIVAGGVRLGRDRSAEEFIDPGAVQRWQGAGRPPASDRGRRRFLAGHGVFTLHAAQRLFISPSF